MARSMIGDYAQKPGAVCVYMVFKSCDMRHTYVYHYA